MDLERLEEVTEFEYVGAILGMFGKMEGEIGDKAVQDGSHWIP